MLEKSKLAELEMGCYLAPMSTAIEIEAAIKSLSSSERKKLVRDLPALLPELDGDDGVEFGEIAELCGRAADFNSHRC